MKSKFQSKDPDIIASYAALRRAAKAAHRLAIKTRTPLWIYKDGKIVNINPNARKSTIASKRKKAD